MLYVLDWCVVCTRLMCCMYWTGELYVLDWCVVCTGLMCCMYWIDVLYVLVHNTLDLLCCMLYEGRGKGVGHCPCTFVKEGGWW